MSNHLYITHGGARPLNNPRTVVKGWVGDNLWAKLTEQMGVKPVKSFFNDADEPENVGLLFCRNGYMIRVTYTWLDLFDVEIIRIADEVTMLTYCEVDGVSLPNILSTIVDDADAADFS